MKQVNELAVNGVLFSLQDDIFSESSRVNLCSIWFTNSLTKLNERQNSDRPYDVSSYCNIHLNDLFSYFRRYATFVQLI